MLGTLVLFVGLLGLVYPVYPIGSVVKPRKKLCMVHIPRIFLSERRRNCCFMLLLYILFPN